MKASALSSALASGLVIAAALGVGRPEVDGQVVFVPAASPIRGNVTETGSLQIRTCDVTPDGLLASGTVTGMGQVITIMVSADDPTSPGVRVGQGFATHVRPSEASGVGGFRVTLPWADESALFAVAVGAESSQDGLAPGPHIVECPH